MRHKPPGDIISTGPDWLRLPEVQALLPVGLQLQHVAQRKSYAGKAWPARGVVRMVYEGIHPVQWLVTLLHELAHVVEYRERMREWERHHGRTFPDDPRQHQRLWRSGEAPHGPRWRQAFGELVEQAIKAELLPGNEQAVRAHAAAGWSSTAKACLDLHSDPRVQWAAPVVEGAAAAAAAAQNVASLPPGTVVYFDGGPNRGPLTGRLVRHNVRSCTVMVGAAKWYVSPSLLRPGPAPST
jgi:hypothetical protein